MDTGVQTVEEADPVGDTSISGGVAQSCPRKTGKRGRPKKERPATPDLTRELAITLRHFFPELAEWLGEIKDPRNPGYIVYPLKVLLLLGMLMFLSHAGSRNHFNDQVRDVGELVGTLARLLGIRMDAMPHLDTLEKVLRRLSLEQVERLHVLLIRRLIRMKALDGWRVGGRFLLAVDGTGLYSFHERHCANCIKAVHESGVVTYSHKVLVAFIVSGDGYALPIACQFIENPGPVYDKQDCEKKAFHRLMAAIKGFFPQTPFWLLLDALYADQNVMRPCFGLGWIFCISFLDTDMPALWREAQALLALSPEQSARMTLPQDEGSREVRWVNDLDYEGMKLSAIFQVDKDKDGQIVRQFAHLVARPIDSTNVWSIAAAARLRWRCENEGFNVLKNGGFGLEHVYSRHPTASKVYFFLMLTAHLIQQLLTRGRLGTVFRDTFHTFLNYGKKLLVALLHRSLPPELDMPGQIRLSSA